MYVIIGNHFVPLEGNFLLGRKEWIGHDIEDIYIAWLCIAIATNFHSFPKLFSNK
jgi:hypothetical protein